MSDVIIIGGGPAGSTMGSYLSMAGISNTIIEGAFHPRPHVGESLVTSTTRIFKEIGFLETMEREGFVKKYGASWHAPAAKNTFSILFSEFPQEGVDQDYTYHVDRAKFDMLMLKHAEGLGSKVIQGVHAREVLMENGKACGVKVNIDGKEVDLPCKFVVDATGRKTLIGHQLKLMKKDPIFNQYAVHAWYEGLDRGTAEDKEHIHIYFLPVERGWVWQIPIDDRITSVGVVTEREVFRESRMDIDKYFETHVQTNGNLAHAMRNARRVNEYKSEGDYSYSMTDFVGNGWLLIGDAARFVDPIFSSGVSVALSSAKFASEQLRAAFKEDDFSQAFLKPYETKLRTGTEVWYEFIRLYYKLLPLFTYFISSKRHRLQVLQLLQGEVYNREEVPVLQAMRSFIEQVEKSEHHSFKGALTDIPIDDLEEVLSESS
ncbi:NAD(P)/FAD-dependent oxidoreductase [Candidatus Nitronereus thalassa]|uniref:NAD(P)/FAD-dependent oxidoreductase n=1 Tax=Candidatus Nitronereus thalassa TaxID=3020898 RepID=A0ABU3K338_9BACT|nr:NAD(P)/FAD-dependent oxidoreductase [Candidatus Nitronereus thalassa]MDT7040802.1 NAD(P)/FAD-dependent oxidoreductase [Candidatus Nitronereus thalassa]